MSINIDTIYDDLRKKHKYIYKVDISKFKQDELAPDEALYKPLTRGEFNFFANQPAAIIYNNIIEKCLLYPNLDDNEWLAGIDDFLYETIIKTSGFNSEEELVNRIENSRKYATTLEAIMTMYICKAFPSYKPSDIDNMTLDEIVELCSLSEQLLEKEIPYLEILHPELVKTKQQSKPRIPDGILKKSNMPQYNNPSLIEPTFENKEVFVDKDNFAKQLSELNRFTNG